MTEITQLLQRWADGDRQAFDEVLPQVYDQLRSIARRQLRGRGSLDTTALVHEFYLKVADKSPEVINRAHLMALSAVAMRQLIVSDARRKLAVKRGAGAQAVTFEDFHATSKEDAEWMIDLNNALEKLRDQDEVLARTFECRYFAGYTEAETAQALETSLRTCQRNWNKARAWIRAELEGPSGS